MNRPNLIQNTFKTMNDDDTMRMNDSALHYEMISLSPELS